ncbi:MAG: hypothetical protein KAT65_10395 [Methanophagales archaeon]|nr:hypothetical protein [Methanophagales archaeon]
MTAKAITYEDLNATFRKGLRNGNWRRLKFLDKALIRAAMEYVKHRGSIVNTLLVEKLLGLIVRLNETNGERIFKRGFEKAVEMLERGEETGVFAWAPQLSYWLKDPDYIFWLGVINFRSTRVRKRKINVKNENHLVGKRR